MATGHLNPGYGGIVTGLTGARRFHSPGLPGHYTGVPSFGADEDRCPGQEENPYLEKIRAQARNAWSATHRNSTSYQDHFRERVTLSDGPTQARPSSPTRLNKPHPPLVFLTCALHDVPGYHNPDALLGKDRYRVDAALPPEDRQQRAGLRKKYATNRPSTAAMIQYAPHEGERMFAGDTSPVDMPDIWRPKMATPVSPYRDHNRADSVLRRLEDDPNYEYQPQVLASHHRYLRPAGYEESMYLTGNGQALGSMHATDRIMRARSRAKHAGQTTRGDFLMHPEWPPNFPQHRLNGLSPASRAYSATRR